MEQALREAEAELKVEEEKYMLWQEAHSKEAASRLEVLEQQLAVQKAKHRVERIRELLNWLKGSPETAETVPEEGDEYGSTDGG